jgi:hypothetical protein
MEFSRYPCEKRWMTVQNICSIYSGKDELRGGPTRNHRAQTTNELILKWIEFKTICDDVVDRKESGFEYSGSEHAAWGSRTDIPKSLAFALAQVQKVRDSMA